MGKIKKNITIALLFTFIFSCFSINSYANASEEYVQRFSFSEALSNPEIVAYLNENNEMDTFQQLQNDLREAQYERTATYINSNLGTNALNSSDVQRISKKYNLDLPLESTSGIIDSGDLFVKRDARDSIVDIWALTYIVNDTSFTVRSAFVDSDNPLDSVTGTINLYRLDNSSWIRKSSVSVNETNVRNEIVYRWSVVKWGVKEKFEYNITVSDNVISHSYDNINENNKVRYNFAAGSYGDPTFTSNGGHKHHFVAKVALVANGYDSDDAYAIRMLAPDHRKTASYGNPEYTTLITQLLANGQYEDALQMEVDNFKSIRDTQDNMGNFQQKYYNEIMGCLYYYSNLFDIEY